MSNLNFNFVPLTFITSESEILRQIRNTAVFSYLFEKYHFTKRLSEIIENTQYGYNAVANDFGTHKFLRISDIKEGEVNWEEVPFCDCKDEETYRLFDDDILVARTGGTTGKSFLINDPPGNAVFAGYLIRIRAKTGIDPIFIYEFLNSYVYWSQISNLKMGSAQPNVNAEKLKSLVIPFAPDEVIQEVVLFLKTGNSSIEELNEKVRKGQTAQKSNYQLSRLFSEQLSLLTALRQAILTEAVQGKLTAQWRKENPNQEPASELLKRIATEKARLIKEKKISKEKPLPPITAEEMPYEVPEGWVWCRLGEVIIKMDAGKSPQCENRSANPDEWGVLKTTSIQKLYFDESENKALPNTVKVSSNLEVTKDDILITRAGPRNRVGIVCAVKNTRPQLMLSDKTVRVKVFDELIFADALAILLSSGVSNTYLESKKSGMAESQVNISQENMKYTPIILPPVSEQHAIVQKVNTLLAYCDELEQQVQQSKADLDLLMQAVLGEVFETERQA